eukprot:CAMPEP_0116823950 /NCGR_PEP_ID=MMETSP0418-20121206/1126_1 /TAXON_ID=1158023 /ORGANISM="Astrosyne radiata, Strain 13vi08-1A" /LENGTH=489 /DNA_ID=CAMNT_0004452267 /DNA_START=5190 /DNA_END=6657 /DNA_ORIENTATION=-
MGPNGSGKSTLAAVLAGKDSYEVTAGDVTFLGKNLLDLAPEERAAAGLFLAFQYPIEIPGVSMTNFLKTAVNQIRKRRGQPLLDAVAFLAFMKEKMQLVNMDATLLQRSLNEGFSGGEKKRNEMFQMAMLSPKLAILDETDSGLDVDALKIVAHGVNLLRNQDNATIIITHYQRMLDYIVPDFVHVLYDGMIVQSGAKALAKEKKSKGMIGLSETKRRFLDKMTHQILKPRNIPLSLQQVLTRRFETLDKKHPFYATRCQALTYLQEQGLPTLTEEDYKYTPITSLLTTHFDFGRSATPEETFPEATIPVYYHDLDAYSIVLLHGQVRNQYTSLQDCGQLMQILTFQEAYQQQQHAFLQHFAQHAPCKTDAFTDLNTALFEEGLFIRIADHAIVEKPLVLYHCTTAHAYQPITYPRILIVIGKNSQASIVMSWQTAGFTNAVTEVVLQESSRLDYYNLQTELDQKNYQVNTTQCQQAKQSTLNTYTFTW